jgi:hypothetical protein
VLDGKRLFVDHNGNGDLTDDGEPIRAKKGLDVFGADGEYKFELDELHEGPRTHKKLSLTVRKLDYLAGRSDEMKKKLARVPDGWGYSLFLDVDLTGYHEEGIAGRIQQVAEFSDKNGFLVFAAKPQDAPILHFGGPRQIFCAEKSSLLAGREKDLMLYIGTPGLGDGTTANLIYSNTVPETVHPRVEITYSPGRPGEPPLKCLYELEERC